MGIYKWFSGNGNVVTGYIQIAANYQALRFCESACAKYGS